MLTEEELKHPFNVGQLLGMMTMLTFIENNNGIDQKYLDKIRSTCANQVAEFLKQPTEDIYLMVDNLAKDIRKL